MVSMNPKLLGNCKNINCYIKCGIKINDFVNLITEKASLSTTM